MFGRSWRNSLASLLDFTTHALCYRIFEVNIWVTVGLF